MNKILLSIPVITKTTGEEQAKAKFAMAQQWDLVNHVRALVFDKFLQVLN